MTTTTIASRPRAEQGATYPRHHVSAGAVALARRLGCSDTAAQRRVERFKALSVDLAAIVRDDPSLAAWAAALVAPVNGAGSPVPLLDDPLMLEAQEADLTEDLAEARYRANPTRDNLSTWTRANSRAIVASKALLAAQAEELAR